MRDTAVNRLFSLRCKLASLLQRCPKVNAINEGEVAQSVASVDISVAVATDGGLITPIVQNVPGLGVAQISETVKVSSLPPQVMESCP